MDVLTRKQTAAILGVSTRTVLNWEYKGILKPNHYISNRPRYLLTDVQKVPTQTPRITPKQPANGE